jgi:internalin A
LDSNVTKASKGRFTLADLSQIWTKKYYSKEIHRKLLSLMMQFELCYSLDNGRNPTYIVPEMLPNSLPEGYEWHENTDLPLKYKYDFMPRGLLTRLIVRLHKHIYTDNAVQSVWKTGVKIYGNSMDCPDTFAEITEAWDNQQLSIRVQGMFAKDLMMKLTQEVDSINNEFFKGLSESTDGEKSRWYKMIPCNCIACGRSVEKHFYRYTELLERLQFKKDTIECQKRPYAAVPIRELIEGVFTKKYSRLVFETEKSAKKIFISYSRKDRRWRTALGNHLAALEKQELIAKWTDQELEAGEWQPQIIKAMENADIYLLLITSNFLASEYISSVEVTTAYSRFKQGQATIIPIICDSCDWELQPITKESKEFHDRLKKEIFPWLGKFTAFPRDAKPIKNWPNQEDGFLDVINQLKKYV